VFDKGAVISLPYGVEGFATPRHLLKEDRKTAKVDEKLPFKVIEFSKEQKRIILSHSRTFEDVKEVSAEQEKKEIETTMEKINKKEKTTVTLGDINVLSELKEQMVAADTKEKLIGKEEKKVKKNKKDETSEAKTNKPAKKTAKKVEATTELFAEPEEEPKPRKSVKAKKEESAE
jgi:small subunit ribosomal protein S1